MDAMAVLTGASITGDAAASTLYLCGFPDAVEMAALLPRLTERLGLRSSESRASTDRLELNYAGTRILLDYGRAVEAALGEAAGRPDASVIGGVAPADDEGGGALRLRLVTDGDGLDQLRAVQRLCCVAAILGTAMRAERLYWQPAHLWSPVAALSQAVAAMEAEGLPPVLHLIAFRYADTQGGTASHLLQSRGLAHFCGLELMLDYPADMAQTDALRRLARLAIHAMVAGPLRAGAAVEGLSAGETLTVGPLRRDADGMLMRVRLRRERHR